jgi:hypothetical protein
MWNFGRGVAGLHKHRASSLVKSWAYLVYRIACYTFEDIWTRYDTAARFLVGERGMGLVATAVLFGSACESDG